MHDDEETAVATQRGTESSANDRKDCRRLMAYLQGRHYVLHGSNTGGASAAKSEQLRQGHEAGQSLPRKAEALHDGEAVPEGTGVDCKAPCPRKKTEKLRQRERGRLCQAPCPRGTEELWKRNSCASRT